MDINTHAHTYKHTHAHTLTHTHTHACTHTHTYTRTHSHTHTHTHVHTHTHTYTHIRTHTYTQRTHSQHLFSSFRKSVCARDGGGGVQDLSSLSAMNRTALSEVPWLMQHTAIHCNTLQHTPGPELIICDEAHRLKNDQTKTNVALSSLPCRFSLFGLYVMCSCVCMYMYT